MIKVVIFDLDDTLISEKSFALSAFGEISIELSKVIKKPISVIYEELVSLYNESPNYIFNRILEKNNIHLNKNFIDDLIYIYRNHKPNIKLSDEVIELLLHLKKSEFHLGLITDGFKSTQINKVISLELDKYIEKIVITDELGDNREFWKPSEKPYTIIKDYFNVEYNEMI
ncbi:HAD family hydrolase, partial [Acholeplasma laidlawii]